jgi:hypothetical protein
MDNNLFQYYKRRGTVTMNLEDVVDTNMNEIRPQGSNGHYQQRIRDCN